MFLPSEAERIGFVYPTYMMSLPIGFELFVNRIEINPNAYLFAITINGGNTGNGIRDLNTLLQERGGQLSYGKSIKSIASYIAMYPRRGNQEKLFPLIAKKMETISHDIEQKTVIKIHKSIGMVKVIHHLLPFATMDKNFNVSDACTYCGICQTVCPKANITLNTGKPVYHHNCDQCMACIQYCPTQAINYKKRTQKRMRYHNPDISAGKLAKLIIEF